MWCDFDFVLGLNINPDIDFNIVNVIVDSQRSSHHVKNVKSAGSDGVIMLCFYSMTS